MIEQRTITINAYRDKEGRPTCAKNVQTGEYCKFLRITYYGLRDICALADDGTMLDRYDEYGCTIPGKDCIVWPT